MKVLLINPLWYRLFGVESIFLPIGLCYLAGFLEREGIDVKVWHADFKVGKSKMMYGSSYHKISEAEQRNRLYKELLEDINKPIWKEVSKVIEEEKPDVVGITCYTSNLKSSINTAKIVKQVNSQIKVVFGGVHPTILPEEVISYPEVDYVVRGEGEATLYELIKALQEEGDLKGIKGLCFKQGGEIVSNPDRELVGDLDSLPFQAKHLVRNYEKYPPVAFQSIFTARGCPFFCTYCGSHNVFPRKVRFRSPENVVDEIKHIIESYGCRTITFCDDTFPLKREHAWKIMDLIEKENLDVTWVCETRPELLDEELVIRMKRTHCQKVAIGIESGDQKILDLIKKGNNLDDIRNARKLLKKHGIMLSAFFMFGFPWETAKEIENTLNFIKEIKPDKIFFNIVTPSPGTNLFEVIKEMGLMPEKIDWSRFYHQSSDMFFSENFTKEEKVEIILQVQRFFDRYNRFRLKIDLLKRFPVFVRMFFKMKMYKHPRYVMGRVRDYI